MIYDMCKARMNVRVFLYFFKNYFNIFRFLVEK